MRFTIRELFLLITVACVSLGWWRERQARVAAVKEAQMTVADARSLAFLSSFVQMHKGGFTIRAIDSYRKLQVKYGAPQWPPQSSGKTSN